jgi:ubiquitin carboxyl-terminal hydrolase 10
VRRPPILILHVKGFCYDMAVGGVVKVGKRVAFGPDLGVGDGSRMSLLKLSFDAGSELMCAW